MLNPHRFIRRSLDPSDRLGEILFGLIMALGIIGAVRVGEEAASNRSLFIAILGCNLAWALVDAVMYVLVALFERGRRAHLIRKVQANPSDAAALELIRSELDDSLEPLATPEARQGFYAEVLKSVRTAEAPKKAALQRGDLLGGAAVALVILMATFPILLPYLLIADTTRAVRLSELIAVTGLFLLGFQWGRLVSANPWKMGAALTVIGGILVGVTILLGG
jgi:VIT1/CCC1 family predicted Fe2+/Mn2+ transporter